MAKRGKKEGRAAVGERPFLYVQVRAFGHATEDQAKVEAALATAVSLDLADHGQATRFRAALQDTVVSGHFNNRIHILDVESTRAGDVRRFWAGLFAKHGIAGRLLSEVEERLDDDLVLWFRLDKQKAALGELTLSTGEDIIHVRAKLATYPKDRQVALAWLREFLAGAVAARAAPGTA